MKSYLALIRIDIKLALRQPSVIFFNYLFPLVFFFVFAQAYRADQGGVITQVVTMVSVIGILGNGLFGAGMRAVQERENNILRRYKVAPISAAPLLVASMVTGLLTYLPYILLMLTLAHFRYGMAFPTNIFSVLLFASFGLIAFRSLGLTVAAVVNSMQESAIITQLLYFAMMFLSGASFPLTMFPKWLMTVTQFIPATYLMSGLQSIMLRKESILQSLPAVGALCLTTLVATFVAVKLFRWEKEEKIKTSAKLWLLAVLMPFIVMGVWQAHSQDNVIKTRVLARELNRSRSILIRNVRIFTGDGKVIETGSILIRNGKIAEIYQGAAPDPKGLKAEVVEGAGKTVLPGLTDVNIRLAASGGFSDFPQNEKQMQRALAGYLYSGITAVRSTGGSIDTALKVRSVVNSGERLGAQLFVYDEAPGSPHKDVDGITVRWTQVDPAIVSRSRARNLPVVVRINGTDIAAALQPGVDAIEPAALHRAISDAALMAMKQSHVAYDPVLRVSEGPRPDELNRPLVLQTAPPELLAGSRLVISSPEFLKSRDRAAAGSAGDSLATAKSDLLRAWQAGVTLVTGSGAGNLLVFHGPTLQRELELWVEAGIPNVVALQAATWNAARLLRADHRFGAIRPGLEATVIIVEGNPLTDIHAMSSITSVILKGERVSRTSLFEEE
jgi:ABC-2 type transport system permease protein